MLAQLAANNGEIQILARRWHEKHVATCFRLCCTISVFSEHQHDFRISLLLFGHLAICAI